jgi:hypothetical protein
MVFVMRSNLVVEANFVPNPFISLAGNYEGLFHESGTIRAESSGMIRLTLRGNGTYTARLIGYGRTNAIVGRFNPAGVSSTSARGRGPRGNLQLQLDVSGASEELTGVFSNAAWAAGIRAYRTGFAQNTNVAGKYTIRLAGTEDGGTSPGGDGYATATVDNFGRVRLAGKLADGTPFTSGTVMSRGGSWPLYISAYRGKGVLLGWMQCATPADIVDATGTWIRPPIAGARLYASGFTASTPVSGSAYTGVTNGLLNLTRAIVIASGGGLSAPITNHVALASGSTFVSAEPGLAFLKVTVHNGVFTGSFLSGGSNVRFEGALLKKQNIGAGFFAGSTSVGHIRIVPVP